MKWPFLKIRDNYLPLASTWSKKCDRKIALKLWTAPCLVKGYGAVLHLEADVSHIVDCLMIVLHFFLLFSLPRAVIMSLAVSQDQISPSVLSLCVNLSISLLLLGLLLYYYIFISSLFPPFSFSSLVMSSSCVLLMLILQYFSRSALSESGSDAV